MFKSCFVQELDCIFAFEQSFAQKKLAGWGISNSEEIFHYLYQLVKDLQ
jgi:hypothetical protein